MCIIGIRHGKESDMTTYKGKLRPFEAKSLSGFRVHSKGFSLPKAYRVSL